MACKNSPQAYGVCAGQRNQYVEVERDTYQDDGCGGQEVVSTETVGGFWAAMKNKSVSEPVEGQRKIAKAVTMFTMLYEDWEGLGIVETDRLLHEGTLFNIRGIDDVDFAHVAVNITADRGVVQ